MSDYEFWDFYDHPPKLLRDNQLLQELKIHRSSDEPKKIKTFSDLEKFARHPKSEVVKEELLEIWEQFELERDESAFRSLSH